MRAICSLDAASIQSNFTTTSSFVGHLTFKLGTSQVNVKSEAKEERILVPDHQASEDVHAQYEISLQLQIYHRLLCFWRRLMGALEISSIFEISWLFMRFVTDHLLGGLHSATLVEWFANAYNVTANKGYLSACSLEEVFNWDLVLLPVPA